MSNDEFILILSIFFLFTNKVCDHFRPIPGQKCKKCNKCDLYKTEDEEKVIKEAATKARNEFLKSHPEARGVNLLENNVIGPVTNEGMLYS